jgi:hypothetical protein
MPSLDSRPRRRWISVSMLVTAWWAATAWLGHQTAPWAIALTTPAFVAGLMWTYVAAWLVPAALSRNRRRVLFRAIAVTLSITASVLVLEAPALAGLVDYSRIRAAITGDWSGPAADFVDDHEFSFRRPPHAHWAGRPRSDMAQYYNLPIRAAYQQTFSTDGAGFRNRVDLNSADIALVGDSYIEGAYISDEETAAVRLQELVQRPVANLGVSGYGSLQELKIVERYALPLRPKMIAWFFFEGNDLDDDQIYENAMAYERGVAAPPSPASRRWRGFENRSFTVNVFEQVRQLCDRLVPNATDSFGWFRDRTGESRRLYFYDFYATRVLGDYERERFETTKAAFTHGNDISRRRGIPVVVFYIPMKFRVYGDFCTFPAGSPCAEWQPWNLESRFARFCREAGIEFISLTEPMRRAAAEGQLLYAPEDSHWNAAGHAFVAQMVAAVWARRGKSP